MFGNANEEPVLPSNVCWPVCDATGLHADKSPLLQAEFVTEPGCDELGFRGEGSCCALAAVKDVATEKTVNIRKHLPIFLPMFFCLSGCDISAPRLSCVFKLSFADARLSKSLSVAKRPPSLEESRQVTLRSCALVGAAHCDNGRNRPRQDLEIEQATPLAGVLAIEHHAPVKRDVAAS